MQITDLEADDAPAIEQAAALLVAGFREHWPDAWPDQQAALEEMREALEPGRICRVARDESGEVIGWVGGIEQYNGHVWELHPLVVREDQRGRGVGRALVEDLEAQVRTRGGLTILLGTDDQDDMTSLAGVELFPDVLGQLARIENRRRHPFEFYQRLGFVVVGVVPHANGWGKPDILMAKRVES